MCYRRFWVRTHGNASNLPKGKISKIKKKIIKKKINDQFEGYFIKSYFDFIIIVSSFCSKIYLTNKVFVCFFKTETFLVYCVEYLYRGWKSHRLLIDNALFLLLSFLIVQLSLCKLRQFKTGQFIQGRYIRRTDQSTSLNLSIIKFYDFYLFHYIH